MGAMVVEEGPEIEQLVFEICRRPEQDVIRIFASNGPDYKFYTHAKAPSLPPFLLHNKPLFLPEETHPLRWQ
jgi:hypothetical protein